MHGTGTRDPAYSQRLEDGCAALGDIADVQPCYWGERHGAWLRAEGASIPEYPTTRAIEETLADTPPDSDEEYQIALWQLLLEDPFAELGLRIRRSPTQGMRRVRSRRACPVGQAHVTFRSFGLAHSAPPR